MTQGLPESGARFCALPSNLGHVITEWASPYQEGSERAPDMESRSVGRVYVSIAIRHVHYRTIRRKLEPSTGTAVYGHDSQGSD